MNVKTEAEWLTCTDSQKMDTEAKLVQFIEGGTIRLLRVFEQTVSVRFPSGPMQEGQRLTVAR